MTAATSSGDRRRIASDAADGGDFAIRAQGLTKTYRLYDRPFDRVKEFLLRRKLHKEVRGLVDVSFTLAHGATVGIIGSNGAGKSTLLKVLSSTTLPTRGAFEMRGRVASLLELGTGFYPGFTGRQNIVLNGIVNGYSRAEIEAKVPEIVEFSELGHFIDQPMRTYSSGMVMRLGFSVATAIDPDVLIIDEILAVGDLHFQKRCVDKIVSFKTAGKTILFCSHSMFHVEEICERALWIKDGRVEQDGRSRDVVLAYSNYERGRRSTHSFVSNAQVAEELAAVPSPAAVDESGADELSLPPPDAAPVILGSRLRDPHTGQLLAQAQLLKDLVVEIDYELPRDLADGVTVGFAIHRLDQIMVCGIGSNLSGFVAPATKGRWRVQVAVNRLPLLAAEYALTAYLTDTRALHVYHSQSIGTRFEIAQHERRVGMIHLDHTFAAEPLPWPTRAQREAEIRKLGLGGAGGGAGGGEGGGR
jgi:ABC-type polysaccharide/polyol phosphate transport system ATPase subunit